MGLTSPGEREEVPKRGAVAPPESTPPRDEHAPGYFARATRGSGKLFDPAREYYVLHEKFWDWGSGDILDETGRVIGKMHRRWFSLRAKIELQEPDGKLRAVLNRKIWSIRQTYDLKDKHERLLGRFRRAILAIIHPKVYLENVGGDKVLEARGNFIRWDYQIVDVVDGHLVAEIRKLDRWRDVFLGGVFDFADKYGVRIYDPDIDRRLVLGFALAIDNSIHDSRHHGIGTHNATRLGNWGKKFGRQSGWRGF